MVNHSRLGALLSSYLFERYSRAMVLSVGLVLLALSTAVAPLWPSVGGFLSMQTAFGIACGILDNGCNVWVIGEFA